MLAAVLTSDENDLYAVYLEEGKGEPQEYDRPRQRAAGANA